MTSEEIKAAMHNFSPVIYDGVEYERITAYIYRVIESHKKGQYKAILQVELLDKGSHSVVIADAKKIALKGEEE